MPDNAEIPVPKILVVDDEEEVASLVGQMLVRGGFQALYAENGTQGFLRAKEAKPDLIILDVNMPIMDGFEVQRLLREYPSTKKIPILFLTGATFLEYEPHALSQGAVGYLKKPIEEEHLLSHVRKLLKMTQAPQE